MEKKALLKKESRVSKPISVYGKAKFLASNFLLKSKVNFKIIILRMYQVYGPYQKNDRLIPQVINYCIKIKNFLALMVIKKEIFCMLMT